MRIYKVRRADGMFFNPGYRTVSWDDRGKTYDTLGAALSAARQATEMTPTGAKRRLDPESLMVVQFELREVNRIVPSSPPRWILLKGYGDLAE